MEPALNPFIWDRPLDDASTIIGMDGVATTMALTLKAGRNVALFAPRHTGTTTFTHRLALELARPHGADAPPFDVIRVNLERVVSVAGVVGCVHDAMTSHRTGGCGARRSDGWGRRRPSSASTSGSPRGWSAAGR